MTHRRVEDLEHAHLSIDQHRLCPICRASVVVSLLKQWRKFSLAASHKSPQSAAPEEIMAAASEENGSRVK